MRSPKEAVTAVVMFAAGLVHFPPGVRCLPEVVLAAGGGPWVDQSGPGRGLQGGPQIGSASGDRDRALVEGGARWCDVADGDLSPGVGGRLVASCDSGCPAWSGPGAATTPSRWVGIRRPLLASRTRLIAVSMSRAR